MMSSADKADTGTSGGSSIEEKGLAAYRTSAHSSRVAASPSAPAHRRAKAGHFLRCV